MWGFWDSLHRWMNKQPRILFETHGNIHCLLQGNCEEAYLIIFQIPWKKTRQIIPKQRPCIASPKL